MSIRAKVLGLVDVVLRVPPIIIIDEIFKVGMGLPNHFSYQSNDDALPETELQNTKLYNSTIKSELEDIIRNASIIATAKGVLSDTFSDVMGTLSQDTDLSGILGIASVRFLLCFFGFLVATCVFLLWTRHLIMVYMFVVSLLITYLSYWSNMTAVDMLQQNKGHILENFMSLNRLLDTSGIAISLAPHIITQWMLGIIFPYMQLGPRYNTLKKPIPLIFLSPIILATLPLPSTVVRHAPFVAKLMLVILIKITAMYSAMEVGKTLYNGYVYGRNFISSFGILALFENEWQRLNVPNVLRVFWIIR